MLTPFPDLLTYGLLAPFLLRLALGALFLKAGSKKVRGVAWTNTFFKRIGIHPARYYTSLLGVIEVATGLMLVAGFYTQVASIASAIICAFCWRAKKTHPAETPGSRGAFLLMFVISLSLLFSGAGFYAFDWTL